MCLSKESISLMYSRIDTTECSFERNTRKGGPRKRHSEVSVKSLVKCTLSAHPCEKRVNHSIA